MCDLQFLSAVYQWLKAMFNHQRSSFPFAGDARAVTEPACNSGIYIAILVAFALCALVVIVVLLLKICRSNGAKKSEKSLWTEQVALNSKPGAED